MLCNELKKIKVVQERIAEVNGISGDGQLISFAFAFNVKCNKHIVKCHSVFNWTARGTKIEAFYLKKIIRERE